MARTKLSHTHRGIEAFKVGEEWRCSGCGTLGRWSDDWSYYGALGCRKCNIEPAIDFVACSEACRAKFDPAHMAVVQDKAAATLPATVEILEARVRVHQDAIRKIREQQERLRGGRTI